MILACFSLTLAACSTAPVRTAVKGTLPPSSSGKTGTPQGGGYYKNDGPADDTDIDMDAIPEPVPRQEPLHRWANRPYEVLGKKYVPMTQIKPFRQDGVASWYGKQFHGQKTSTGETYNMFAMTAAHPTLPLPSFARVTNPANGKSVTLRVNDRGPFHSGRIIDLSYAAAHRLGYIPQGSGRATVELIVPGSSPPPVYTAPPPVYAPVQEAAPNEKAENTPTEPADEISRLLLEDPAEALGIESSRLQGIFLQLGAFSNPDNAKNLKARLNQELEWLNNDIHIEHSGSLYRLQLGPFAERAKAERAAQKIREDLGYSPVIVTR